MYKNQLQELAQRSCFNLPSYTCIREGPDHAPRFKAIVCFNGENFECPHYCSNLRQAEHSAAEAALASISSRGPSQYSLAARILDETGVYKNLLQEIAQRVGSPLPRYTTFRSGLGHLPVFTGTVELAGIVFKGEPAKNKKQAEKNAALASWLSLKQLAQQDASSSTEQENNEEQEQIRIARALQNYRQKEKSETGNLNGVPIPFQQKFSVPTARPSISTSKILPLFCQKNASSRNSRPSSIINDGHTTQMFTAFGAAPYLPHTSHCGLPYQGIAPPVTMRTSIPVFSAPPSGRSIPQVMEPRPIFKAPSVSIRPQRPMGIAPPVSIRPQRPTCIAPPVCIRQAVPVFAAPAGRQDPPPSKLLYKTDEAEKNESNCEVDESTAIRCLEQLEM
ncbi:hypothetical protein ABFS82_14G243400 [Erythranthe guttata]|uniref:double-stranded RNA-binding protein 2 n=1 Tax=Erythranthe guttata TaxID=4155 RepID=UPI00064D75DB|nr:PREDICTED: double-stranded RNA-binding protein 2 [Erythranthe guttata]|eukprot:XP_012838632.1 PREDICTED: double-stranded RNA-binding protein 2 [Erythranthe guttata]